MGTTTGLLVGIACVLAQGSPEATKLKESLTPEEAQVIESLQTGEVCQQLDTYIQEGKDPKDIQAMVMGCQSCLKTSMLMKNQNKENAK